MLLGVIFLAVCVLYAAAFLVGWYLARRGRLDVDRIVQSQRAFAALLPVRPSRALMLMAVLEFGAYLLATALGVNLVVTPVVGGALTEALSRVVVFYPLIAAMLLLGAHLEVAELRSKIPAGFQLPEGVTVQQLRAKAWR